MRFNEVSQSLRNPDAWNARTLEYIVHGGDIMGKFKALQSAFVIDSKESNVPKDGTKNVTKDVTIEEAIVTHIATKLAHDNC